MSDFDYKPIQPKVVGTIKARFNHIGKLKPTAYYDEGTMQAMSDDRLAEVREVTKEELDFLRNCDPEEVDYSERFDLARIAQELLAEVERLRGELLKMRDEVSHEIQLRMDLQTENAKLRAIKNQLQQELAVRPER